MQPSTQHEIERPNDLQAEAAVLGAVLIDRGTEAIEAASALRPSAFYYPANRQIYKAMIDLYEAGEAIDMVTLTQQLVQGKAIERIGGVEYLSQIAKSVPTEANAEHYVRIVRELHIRRQIIEAAHEQEQLAIEGGDVSDIVSKIQRLAAALSDEATSKQEFIPIREVLMDVFDEIETLNEDPERNAIGIPSGFTELDRMTAGFQKTDLIILAARPSVGKTAFALNVAKNVAIRSGETVALFSLEMSTKQLTKRMIVAEAGFESEKMRTGRMEDDDWQKFTIAASTLSDAPIYIDDTVGMTVHDIRSKCRKLKKEKGLGMIIIDYLQLIAGRAKSENRQQEVSEISRTLKQIAKELDVPVIALSQLSRGVEQRQDKRPMMSDLRESGSIEQDADIVAFLYRDDYYNADTEKKNIVEVILAKQRNGPVGTVELVFLKDKGKFLNYERVHTGYDAGMEQRYG